MKGYRVDEDPAEGLLVCLGHSSPTLVLASELREI